MGSYNPLARLQTKEGICEYLGGISATTYDHWHAKGLVPGPIAGTTRYDTRLHDRLLDGITGITEPRKLSPLEEFEASARAA